MSEDRYEVTFVTGPPGFADITKERFATLAAAREYQRESPDNDDPYFRWSKITDLTTGKQLLDDDRWV